MRSEEDELKDVLRDFELTGNVASLNRLKDAAAQKRYRYIELHIHKDKLMSKIHFTLKVETAVIKGAKLITVALNHLFPHKAYLRVTKIKTTGNVPTLIQNRLRKY